MKRTSIDMQAIKRIPILLVAESLGMHLIKTGGDTWQPKEKNGVSSLTLFGQTNSFVRFSGNMQGGVDKGSVIDFVMHVKNDPDVKKAIDYLATFL